MRAWYRDISEEDPSDPHMTDPPRFLDIPELIKQTRMSFYKIDADKYEEDAVLKHLRQERGLISEHVYNISHTESNYDALIARTAFQLTKTTKEHLHETDELQFVVDGGGYIEVRDLEDKWIRLQVEKGDMYIMPRGQYHRLSPAPENRLIIKRFYVDEPHTVPFYRRDPATDGMDVRTKFLASRQV